LIFVCSDCQDFFPLNSNKKKRSSGGFSSETSNVFAVLN